MSKDKDIMGTVRRWGVRIGLEVMQGLAVQNTRKIEDDEIPENIEESLNNPYVNREGVPLCMDIFKPSGPEFKGKELPVIVHIHGGGLVTGDRKLALKFARFLSSRGYLVFTIEYRLAPRATVREQLDDICAGMDYVGRKIVDYDVDFTRVFLTAESAGAFLAIYTTAMKRSRKLQDVIGYKPSRMTFKAIGLSCGMFYTNRDDILGHILSEQFYGDKKDDRRFLQYMNPEHPEIINNLPPTFLATSRGDFLNNYTVMFEKALKKAGNTTHMVYYGNKDLIHTFNFAMLDREESQDANNKMLAFFEEQADIQRARQMNIGKEKRKIQKITQQIQKGSFAKQKMWRMIQDINSQSEDRLSAVAIADDDRQYSYRQMFRRWNNYAEVFSALEMTRKNSSIVGIPGAMTAEAIFAFYALNMTGAEISMLPYPLMKDADALISLIREEKITDLVLTDYQTTQKLLKKLAELKEELGLRIIILETKIGGPCISAGEAKAVKEKISRLKKAENVRFMSDLLTEYEAFPIQYNRGHSATILHRFSAEDGRYVPVYFTDEKLNSYVLGLQGGLTYKELEKHSLTGLTLDLYNTHSLSKQMMRTFLMNDTLVLTYKAGYNKDFHKAVARHDVDTLTLYPGLLEQWMQQAANARINFASLSRIYVEDAEFTEEKQERYQTFIKENGGNTEVTVSEGQAEDYLESVSYFAAPAAGGSAAASVPGGQIPMLPQLPYTPNLQPMLAQGGRMARKQSQRAARRQRIEKTVSKIVPVLQTLSESQVKDKVKETVKTQVKERKDGEQKMSGEGIMAVAAALFDANATDYDYEL